MWNPSHPEDLELRRYTWRQAAELAIVDAQRAAELITAYEGAHDAGDAMTRGFAIETARAEAACALRRAARAFSDAIDWTIARAANG
jgi:hypothetical protein